MLSLSTHFNSKRINPIPLYGRIRTRTRSLELKRVDSNKKCCVKLDATKSRMESVLLIQPFFTNIFDAINYLHSLHSNDLKLFFIIFTDMQHEHL